MAKKKQILPHSPLLIAQYKSTCINGSNIYFSHVTVITLNQLVELVDMYIRQRRLPQVSWFFEPQNRKRYLANKRHQ